MMKVTSGETPAVLATAEVFSPATGLSVPINPMTTNRSHHSAVVLQNGDVLIVGGVNALFAPLLPGPAVPWILPSSDLFNLVTGRFTSGAKMATPRDSPSAVMLNSGKVLIVGGGANSAELYDPETGKFSVTGSMSTERYGQTATVLTNGKVLITGGGAIQAELYDPDSRKFTLTGSMQQNRIYHTATLLLDGRVLITGGSPYARSSATDTTELYDPLSGTFEQGAKMQESRAGHTATLLTNGQVLIAGGHDDNSAEIYDPVADQFERTGTMSASRFGHSAIRWPDGRVFIAGGWSKSYQPLATTESYDFKTGQFTPGGNMTEARADHTASLISVRWPPGWAKASPAGTAVSVPGTPQPPAPLPASTAAPVSPASPVSQSTPTPRAR
ncbi:MAG: hypothetical protein JO166_22710 [Deltaproteobacteria bacterium]|nr:hypothetical protein [Deltaproteobacteria bacterium]